MGSGSAIGFAPDANIGIAVLTNIEGGDGLASKIVWRFYDLYFNRGVSQAQLEQHVVQNRKMLRPVRTQAQPTPAGQVPALSLANYCGVYNNPAYGNFVVSQSGNNLVITMGPQRFGAKLVPVDQSVNKFLAYLPDYPDGYEFTIPVNSIFESGNLDHRPDYSRPGRSIHPDPKLSKARRRIRALLQAAVPAAPNLRVEANMKISRGILRNLALACCLLAVVFYPAGVRADWLQDLEADAVAWMTAAGIPGMSIAIVQNDTIIYAKGFGHLQANHNSPTVDANTIFSIGSCSKAFVAVQVAMLADQQKLAWNDLVSKHLPYFGMYDPWVNGQFQVEDLLCHRSGLTAYSLFPTLFLGYPPPTQVGEIRQQPITSFRTTFAYQNHMYVAASELVAAKTGQTWNDTRYDKPLGMTRSFTTQAEVNKMDNVATGYLILTDGSVSPISKNWYLNYFFDDYALSAGAIRSTALDMAQWLRLNLSLGKFGTEQIVSETNMRYLQSPWVLMAPWAAGPGSPYLVPYLMAPAGSTSASLTTFNHT